MNADQRLYAVVLRLAAQRPGAIPADHGKLALSALYDLLRLGDQELAQELHDNNQHKPFTVSLLNGGKTDREGARHFGAGDGAEWRFTLLRDPAFETLLRRYAGIPNLPHIRIGTVSFQITDAFISGSHPDSGCVSLDHLIDRYNQPPEAYAKTILLDFLTPTAFALGTDAETRHRRLRTLPDPRTLFSALRKRWAGLGGPHPGDAFDEWVQINIEAEPLRLSWQSVQLERVRFRGFIGQIRFVHWGADARWLPFLHLLAELSFYTGAGYQTTRGMGRVRLLAEGNGHVG